MEEIEIKLADPRTANFAGATRNLKKRLAVAKANVVALRNAYTKTYL
jgi:inorganic triphosphatase YgiF